MNRKYLEKWLKDAYAMEKSGEVEMEKQIRDFGDFPEIQARIEGHLEETRRHSTEIGHCLGILGFRLPLVRDAVTRALAGIAAIAMPAGEDKVLKNLLANAALERFEISAYRSLIVAAEDCGEEVIGATCRNILREEEEAERVYEQLIPMVADDFISTKDTVIR
jgi:ferritin-like metal-binding protein YciE